MKIFGVHISGKNKKEIQKEVKYLFQSKGNLLVTPNPEILVAARESAIFRNVLNEAAVSIPDGIGLTLATLGRLHRYTGVDLLEDIFQLAQKEQKSTYIVGRNDQKWKSQVTKSLKSAYPSLHILGVAAGPKLTLADGEQGRSLVYEDDTNNELLADIIQSAPDILVVGFGHEKQELWLHEHLPGLPSVAIGIGVGGAIDYLAGIVPRAPQWMRNLGLEWLFRVFYAPKRLPRIATALIVFPILYIYEQITNKQ